MARRKFSNWIEACATASDDSIAPQPFQVWSAVSAIAGALGRTSWYSAGQFKITPNLYVVLIADRGRGKSVALHLPFDDVFAKLTLPITNNEEDLAIARSSYERYLERPEDHPLYMERDRITPEKLVVDMRKITRQDINLGTSIEPFYDASVTVVTSEFGTFMQRNFGDLQMLLTDSWDAKAEYSYRTKTAGSYIVKGPCVNWIACATPAQFVAHMPEDAMEQGLLSRIIPVFFDGDKSDKKSFYKPHNPTYINQLREDLAVISRIKGEFTLDKGLREKIDAWMADGMPPQIDDPTMEGFNERRFSHLMKVAICFAASKNANRIITDEDWEGAKSLLGEAEKMMPQALENFGMSKAGRLVEELAYMVRLWYDGKGKPMPITIFKAQALKRVSSPAELPAYIESMIESKLVNWTDGRTMTHIVPGR